MAKEDAWIHETCGGNRKDQEKTNHYVTIRPIILEQIIDDVGVLRESKHMKTAERGARIRY